jgi:hypothetical protein
MATAACNASGCTDGCSVSAGASDNCGFDAGINGYICRSYCGPEPTLTCSGGQLCSDASGTPTCSAAPSCAAILAGNPSAASGPYTIDPDGAGGNAAFSVTCDMVTDGGGWTQISFEDFAAGATGWSDPRISSCGTLGSTLGGYNTFGAGATSNRTYDMLGVPHTEVRVSLDYVKFDTWDGESARVDIDSVNVFSQAIAYTEGPSNQCGTSWPELSIPVVETVTSSNNTLNLRVTSTLDQAADDEAFGVDNVRIMVR